MPWPASASDSAAGQDADQEGHEDADPAGHEDAGPVDNNVWLEEEQQGLPDLVEPPPQTA